MQPVEHTASPIMLGRFRQAANRQWTVQRRHPFFILPMAKAADHLAAPVGEHGAAAVLEDIAAGSFDLVNDRRKEAG